MSDAKPIKYTFKKDRYMRARGASQFFDLFCTQCKGHLLLYQKDGAGSLKRLYLDRIFAPQPFSDWQRLDTIADVPNLVCPHCGTRIGSPMIYRPEDRNAIRLVSGRFSKVRSNGAYPPAEQVKPNST